MNDNIYFKFKSLNCNNPIWIGFSKIYFYFGMKKIYISVKNSQVHSCNLCSVFCPKY